MKFHRIIRKIHLVASMVMLSFMLIYIFSGIILINRDLFTIPEVQQNIYTKPVEQRMDGNPESYANYLKENLDLKGRIEYHQDRQNNWIYNYNFPGDHYQVRLSPQQDSLYIQHNHRARSFFMVVQGIHVLRGFKGGWAYTAWAVMYDISFTAMLVFAITGMMIWYRNRQRFRYGLWYLAAGLALPGSMILFFMCWK